MPEENTMSYQEVFVKYYCNDELTTAKADSTKIVRDSYFGLKTWVFVFECPRCCEKHVFTLPCEGFHEDKEDDEG